MQGIELLLAFDAGGGHLSDVADDGSHACHGLTEVIAGRLDFLLLHHQLIDDGFFLLPYIGLSLHAEMPGIANQQSRYHINQNHPPGEPPRGQDGNLELAHLVAGRAVSSHSLHMEGIGAAGEPFEIHAMAQRIAVAPIMVESLHEIGKLEALTLVVVACGKLDGKGVLTV